MAYFECNLPMTAPDYVTPSKKAELTQLLQQIHARMKKLDEALEKSGMPGEQFAAGAKLIFDCETETGEPLLDSYDSETLAAQVKAIASNMKYEPREEWDNTIVLVDTAFLRTDEWEAVRRIGIGGSDAAVALGISPYRTEQELYHDKIGTEFKIPDTDTGKQFIFDYGHKVEPLVISEFCRRTGAKVIPETRMFAKKGMPYITANIDAIVRMLDGRIFVFEAKTTTFFNKDAWAENKVPPQYVPQCRQYMSVLDDPKIQGTYIGCIYGNTPNDFVCSYILRDFDAEDEQLEAEEVFWHNHILARREPDLSGEPEKDIELIRKKSGYADKDMKPIDIEPDSKGAIDDYLALDEERKMLEKKASNIKERQRQISIELIEQLGKATKGIFPKDEKTFFEVSYAPRSSEKVDKDLLRLAFPDAYNAAVTKIQESSRVFSIKIKNVKAKETA